MFLHRRHKSSADGATGNQHSGFQNIDTIELDALAALAKSFRDALLVRESSRIKRKRKSLNELCSNNITSMMLGVRHAAACSSAKATRIWAPF